MARSSTAACAIAALCLVAAVSALPSPPGYSFDDWLAEYPRTYSYGTAAYNMRRAIFNQKAKEVEAHNANRANTYTRTMRNRWADMTLEEIRATSHGGGVYHGPPTPYTRQYDATGDVDVSELPASIDYRNNGVLTAVKDQGNCGSCYAFASTESVESAVAISSGQLPVLSPQQAAFCTSNPNDCGGTGGCGGGTAELVFASIISIGGMASQWTYPYMSYYGGSFQCQFKNSQSTGGTPPQAIVSSYVKLPHNNYTAVMNTLARTGPVAISVDAAAWHDYDSGVYTGCGTDTVTLDHNVQMVGYGTDPKTGLDYWLVRNSWGASYGEEGFIRVHRFGMNAPCAEDTSPGDGDGCNNGPKEIKVCGSCGILYDTTYPIAHAPTSA